MPRENFVKEYVTVRKATFKTSTIKSAWKKSGAWPVNRNVFHDDDYAPSIPYSTHASCVPTSYPSIHLLSDDEQSHCDDSSNDEDDQPDLDLNNDNNGGPSSSSSSRLHHVMPRFSPVPSHQFYAIPPTTPTSARGSARRPALLGRKRTYDELEKENDNLWGILERSEANSQMALEQLRDATRKLNAKETRRSKRPKLNVDARCLTSSEGLALSKKQQEEKNIEMQRKSEAQAAREAKDKERQQARQQLSATTAVFTGSLNSKRKEDLKDIAFTLGVAQDGTKDAILTRIREHFNTHAGLSADPRYRGLFGRSHTSTTNSTLNSAASASSSVVSYPSTSQAPVYPSYLPLSPRTNVPVQSHSSTQLPQYSSHFDNSPVTYPYHIP
ncbi:hypothetical protein F5878DRAFT_410778, partial [Lentinula raphanica]